MKVIIRRPTEMAKIEHARGNWPEPKHELNLFPENAADREVLQRLIDDYQMIGMGMANNAPDHVRIELTATHLE